ncbi:MAG TPA: glycoside hydrolase family 3 N-terminal domain-containing protein [Usitatibacter sp.]
MPQLEIIARCRTFATLVFPALACAALAPAAMAEAPLRSLERTGFPEPFALACSWDPLTVRETYSGIAVIARANGTTMVLGPSLEIGRDPRRGHIEQSFGEDPYLVGEMGLAAIEGLQGAGKPHGLAAGKVFAAITGFAGPGLPADGVGPTPVAERELRELYFPPFEQVLRRTSVGAIVPSRNEIDGVPSHANAWLLKDILRGEWKYGGTVIASREGIADLYSVYHVAVDAVGALSLARDAGADAGPTDVAAFVPSNDAPSRALALKAAQRSITLLANDGELPLSLPAAGRTPMKIALVELGTVTPMQEELRARIRDRATVVTPGQADHIVVAVGEIDAAAQRESVTSLAAFNKPIILVFTAMRPFADPDVVARAKAVLGAWGLGDAGPKAIVSVLFGDVNPGGKLAATIARDAGQLPLFYNAKPSSRRGYLFDSSDPLYTFGWGLSYSSFELGPPLLSSNSVGPDGSVTVSVEVRNHSKRAGDETIQLYVHGNVSPTTRPVKELKGFQRVSLKPGEKRTVRFTLEGQGLAIWDMDMHRLVVPGEYEVMTGPNSVALKSVTLRVRKGAGK